MNLSTQRSFSLAAPLLCLVATYASVSHADNPIVQTNFTSDPAPFVYDGTMYLVTTHDENAAGQPCTAVAGYTLCRWYTYSSKDMVNWTDHGVVASWSTFSWASTAAWAPQAIPRNGKFYIYVPLSNKSGATVIGVGVATSPTGPYQDAIGKPLVTGGCPGGSGDIDPTVFIDDDKQAYLYFGRSVPGYVKLNEDMTSYSGSIQCPTANTQSFGPKPSSGNEFPTQYEEGPWITKHGSTYILAYAANGIPEDIAYSTASAPGGPFTYAGTIMKATGASFTNHTGIVDFNGHSYFFYHNGALKKGGSVPSNGDGYHRSVCLEEFTYNADGSIPTIAPTSGGPKAIANLNPYSKTEAETIAWESGVTTEDCSEGGMDVTAIGSGDYIKVKNVDFGSGATSFTARVAAAAAGGTIEIRLGSQTGTLVGTCTVAATGGAQKWADTTCTVSGATGVNDLFFVFGGNNTFNFNSWQFTGTGGGGNTGGTGAGGGSSSSSVAGGTTSAGGSAAAGGTQANGGSSSNPSSTKATGGNAAAGGAVASTGGASSTTSSKGTGGATTAAAAGGASTASSGGKSAVGGSAATITSGTVNPAGGAGSTGGSSATNTRSSGGSAVTGGAATTKGNATATAAGGSQPSNSSDTSSDEGCGCRVAARQSPSSSLFALGALGLLSLHFARRRRNS